MSSILITGGSGFLGHGLVEQLLTENWERICVYSRGEHSQAHMAQRFNDERLRFFIGDVRDRDRLHRAMMGVETVIHAAALKRIEVGNYDPVEMVKTNVMGSVHAVESAVDAHIKHFVFVSSDKAWQPISPYGQSKALAERIVLNANAMYGWHGPTFAACRYGNVFNSQGSVVPKWMALKKSGKTKVPVTDPDCTRFYMTLEEAAELVLNAVGSTQMHIPDLPAYRLGDLAEAMYMDMEIIGLPHYEKKNEGMRDGLTSDTARRMDVDELRMALNEIDPHLFA